MSLGSENGLSVADIAAVTDRNNGNCGNGWGGGPRLGARSVRPVRRQRVS